MTIIMETVFGSHLYGTETPASDRDWKAVHLPPARDILLQRIKPTISEKTKADGAAKNTADDIDRESWALHQFFKLIREGQTVAMDALFSTHVTWTRAPSPLWLEIVANRHRLVSRKAGAFLGYCRQQANKYGIKGSRMAAARRASEATAELLAEAGTQAKLGDANPWLRSNLAGMEHIEFVERPAAGGGTITHLSVCGRLAPYTATIKNAHEIFAKLFAEYGKRALAAEQNEGVDWKALSHAVRVGRQALELLETGHMTFPRPERVHLVKIKMGALAYQPVAEEIEGLLMAVEEASVTSLLPAEPDMAWMDDLICRAYASEVARG